jgi:membrane-associated protein
VAGVAQMPYRRFAVWNILGGASWVFSMLTIGFFVGKTPLGKHIEAVIVVIVLLSISPGIYAWIKSRRSPNPNNGRREAPADR